VFFLAVVPSEVFWKCAVPDPPCFISLCASRPRFFLGLRTRRHGGRLALKFNLPEYVYQRGSRRLLCPPKPPLGLPPPKPPPSVFGRASFTFKARPFNSAPFKALIAFCASV